MKLTDALSKTLIERGIDTAFGVQGGAAANIFHSLETSGINVIYTLHEQAASLAAASYARASGKIGCVVVTSGPGGTNTLTGVLGAWQDSVPCIYISGGVRSPHLSYGKNVRQVGTQEAPIVDIVKPITKYSKVIRGSGNFCMEINKAIDISMENRSGPVWIDIPLDVQLLQLSEVKYNQSSNPLNYFSGELEKYKYVIDYLNKSDYPLMILGNGIHQSTMVEEIRNFISNNSVPFVTTWTGQDLFTTKNILNLGVIGMSGQKGANQAVFFADLLLCVGTHLSIPQTTTLIETFAPQAKKIIVDIDSEEIRNCNVKFDLSINANLRSFIPWLNKQEIPKNKWDSNIKSKFKDLNWYEPKKQNGVNSFVYNKHLTSLAPPKSCFIVDGGGTIAYTGFQSTQITHYEQRIIGSSSMSSMGTGLAETVGVFATKKFEKLFCIIGDGSFAMNIQDLQTISSLKIPVVISVINNNGYLAIRQTQDGFMGSKYYGTHPDWGLKLPDTEQISKAFDVEYIRLENPNAINDVSEILLTKRKPIVCEVIVDQDQDILFQQKYKDMGEGVSIPQPLSDMYP